MKEFISSDTHSPEMLAAQAFDNILNGIQRSNLNFQLQVSPFSAQISLKKSLIKDRSGSFILPSPPLQVAASSSSSLISPVNNDLANLVARNISLENELSIQKTNIVNAISDREEAIEKLINLEKKLEAVKQENKTLVAKLENKSGEIKLLKSNIEDLSKEKNSINVALRSAKQDIKAQGKISEKKMSEYEKKIHDLNDFKVRKLNEERQERIRKKKELKKEAKKMNNNNNSQGTGNDDFEMREKDTYEKTLQKSSIVEEAEKQIQCEAQSCSMKSQNCDQLSTCLPQQSILPGGESNVSDGLEKASEDRYKNVELEEKEDGFIGPRLPRMLTDEEVKALIDKALGDKYR